MKLEIKHTIQHEQYDKICRNTISDNKKLKQ